MGDTLSIYLCLQQTGLIIGKDKSGLGLKRAQCQQKTATWVGLELQRKEMDKTIHRFDRSDIRGVCLFSQVFQSNSANTIFGKQRKKNDTIIEKYIYFFYDQTAPPASHLHRPTNEHTEETWWRRAWTAETRSHHLQNLQTGRGKNHVSGWKRIETTHYDR